MGQRIDTKNANVPIVDSTNNVEQITIASGDLPANGAGGISTLAVTVSAFNVPSGPQQYALVMTGDSVTELAASACAFACPASCSNQGTCNAGRCECNAGFAGADCSIAVTTLTIGSSSPVSGSLSADGWIYYMFQPDTSKNLDVRFKVTANQGVPVFFGQAGEYPTPASASARLTSPPRACTMSPSMASPTTARRTPPPPPRSSLRPPTSASLKTSPLPSPSLLL